MSETMLGLEIFFHLSIYDFCFHLLPISLKIFPSLNCSSISHDGSLVAGGFSDSSLKVSHVIDPNLWMPLISCWLNSNLLAQVWDMAKLGHQGGSCKFLKFLLSHVFACHVLFWIPVKILASLAGERGLVLPNGE